MKLKRIAALLCAIVILLVSLSATVAAAEATGVKLNATAITIGVGQAYTMKVTLTPAGSTTSKKTWKSASTSVATVDSTGKITGKKAGTATISVTTAGGKTASVKVTVKPAPTKLVLASALSLYVGQTSTPAVTTTPSNAQTTRTWKSSNTAVAKVDSTGKITPLKVGTCYITVTSYNNKTSNKLKLTVKAKPKPTKITADKTAVTLGVGQTFKPKLTFTPYYANTSVKYTSSDSKIAKVDSGGKITAVKSGKATIYVYSNAAKKNMATIIVTVKPVPKSVKGTTVTSASSPALIGVGQTTTIGLTISPSDALNTRSYTSSNTSVLTVDSSGKVTAKKAGTASVKVTMWNKVYCYIYYKVLPKPTKVAFKASAVQVLVGKTYTSGLTYTPADARTTRTYSSSNTKIATVSSSGVITGVAVGSCTIKVKTYNGIEASVPVTVTTQAIIDSVSKLNAVTKAVTSEKPGYTYTQTGKQNVAVTMTVSLLGVKKDITSSMPEQTDTSTSTVKKGASSAYLGATSLKVTDVTAATIAKSGTNTKYTLTLKSESTLGKSSALYRLTGENWDSAELKKQMQELSGDVTISSLSAQSKNVSVVATVNSSGKLVALQYKYDICVKGYIDPMTVNMTLGMTSQFSSFVR
ncbi:MAG: Ig-like domain-containing protein [Clostridium sp.]|jgi:uncharacterized protein YjdB|nr:Ig-like domain-containing protein [Clostridium sp.]